MATIDTATGEPDHVQSEAVLRIGGVMGLRDAKGFRTRLSKSLDAAGDIEIDARELTGVDISIVQLLVSAGKVAAREGREILVHVEPGGVLETVLDQAGFRAAEDGRLWEGVKVTSEVAAQ